jgi:hypothetical protein
VGVHAYTSCSFSYLNRARVLADSLRRHNPDWTFWLVMTDREPPGFNFDIRSEPFDRILYVDELFGEETESWLFGHDIVEACTAVKGRAAKHMLADPDCDKLFYFDPDTAVFNTMSDVADMLDTNSIVLTPHQTEPEAAIAMQAIMDNEITSLHYGTYNLGFCALKNDSEGRRFARWWEERLYAFCHDRLDIGLFVDQKWCNLAPGFFDGVVSLRDPGYNVASWNLSHRRLSFDQQGVALVNGRPLRFFHFTKLGPVGDMMTQKYAKDNLEVYELWIWYRRAVERASSPLIPKGWWQYGQFDNGVKIPKNVRELYREREDLKRAFRHPFRVEGDSYFAWLNAQTELLTTGAEHRGFVPV